VNLLQSRIHTKICIFQNKYLNEYSRYAFRYFLVSKSMKNTLRHRILFCQSGDFYLTNSIWKSVFSSFLAKTLLFKHGYQYPRMVLRPRIFGARCARSIMIYFKNNNEKRSDIHLYIAIWSLMDSTALLSNVLWLHSTLLWRAVENATARQSMLKHNTLLQNMLFCFRTCFFGMPFYS